MPLRVITIDENKAAYLQGKRTDILTNLDFYFEDIFFIRKSEITK